MKLFSPLLFGLLTVVPFMTYVAEIALTSVFGGYIITFPWCEILLLLGKALCKVFSRETK
jgi:hypothetical protein